MKCLSIFLVNVLVLCCTKTTVEIQNPHEGTTWESISFKATGDTILEGPQSDYERGILIYGKTHYALTIQDTSRDESHYVVGTYIYKGDSCTYTLVMHPYYEDIGYSWTYKIQIEGDTMVATGEDLHFEGHDWKTCQEVYKRID